MMGTQIVRPGLRYEHRSDGIHEFVFTGDDADNSGLDHFFEVLRDLLERTPPNETLRYIVDASQGKQQLRPPIAELVRRFRKLEAQLPERAAGRTALLHDGSVLLTLANTIIDTLAPDKDKTRFFTVDRREQAIRWLLSEA